jgi:hypothetical protein
MRGIYNADFTVDALPQAALRLHAVNCTQPLQGCITICLLSILIPNSRSFFVSLTEIALKKHPRLPAGVLYIDTALADIRQNRIR